MNVPEGVVRELEGYLFDVARSIGRDGQPLGPSAALSLREVRSRAVELSETVRQAVGEPGASPVVAPSHLGDATAVQRRRAIERMAEGSLLSGVRDTILGAVAALETGSRAEREMAASDLRELARQVGSAAKVTE